MSDPMVSVVMLTYNHLPYISRSIHSILKQKSDFLIELVIGEDFSNDGTREIVLEYQKRYPHLIRVVISDENVGLGKNWYRTEIACRGKYIAYCEGDDYWHHPDKLKMQVEYMESHPECGLIHSDYDRYFVESGKRIDNFNLAMGNIPPDNLSIGKILRGGKYLYILTCTVMVRRYLMHEVITSDSFLHHTNNFATVDTSRWAEIAQKSKTHYINASLSTYNIVPSSVSKPKDPVKQLLFGKSVSEVALYLAAKYSLSPSEYEYHTSNWLASAIPYAYYSNDKQLATYAIKHFRKHCSLKQWIFYFGTTNSFVRKLMSYLFLLREKVSPSRRASLNT